MAERFQPKSVQPSEVPASPRGLESGQKRKREYLAREDEIRLGQQMDMGRRLMEKAQLKLKEKAEFEPGEKEKILGEVKEGEKIRVAARDHLVEAFIPLAKILAKKFKRDGIDLEDLSQDAAEALTKAADRFDWNRGVRFSTFATPTIEGELRHRLRDNDYRPFTVPRPLKDNYRSVFMTAEKLTQDLQREPTDEEIGNELKKSSREVKDIFQAMLAEKSVKYLDSTYNPASEDAPQIPDPNLISEDAVVTNVIIRNLLTPNVETGLDERSKKILKRRFYDEWTQGKIGEELGISQMHISRLEKKALKKLREMLGPQGDE